MTSVAVVIPCRDRAPLLGDAIDAARRSLRPGDELLVVDSASPTAAVRETAARAGVRYVRAPEPGASLARNVGVAATTAPVVAFTDDDCRPGPDWVPAVADAFEDPLVGVVAGRVVAAGPSGPLVLSVTPLGAAAGDDPMGIAHGANLAFRRAALGAVGGFDELLGPGAPFHNGEDYDATWRVVRAGWGFAYEPRAVVEHVQWRSRWAALATYFRYGIGDGAFAAKALRLDPAARSLLTRRLWSTGLRAAAINMARGNEWAATAGGLKAVGVVVGVVRARRVALQGEHFRR